MLGVAGQTLANWPIRFGTATLALALTLLVPRALILHGSSPVAWPGGHLLKDAVKLCFSGVYDTVFALGLGAAFTLVFFPLRRRQVAAPLIYRSFLIAAALCVVAAFVNVEFIALVGRPFNFQWFYYSDFLQSADSRQAILSSLTPRVAATIAFICLGYVLLSIALGRWAERSRHRLGAYRFRWIVLAIAVTGLIFLVAVEKYVVARGWPYDKLANSVYEFARSWVIAERQPPLFSMKTPFPDVEFSPAPETQPSTLPHRAGAIRHVVVFVLESTPAEYVGVYGSRYPVTPNLDRWSKQAAIFENIYAHAPASNKSLFSILCSAYPWISFRAETEAMSNIKLPSLPSVLKTQNYVSGFFSSTDLSYQAADKFLAARGFDVIQDYKTRPNSRKVFTNHAWPFLNGSDDSSTTKSLTDWFQHQQSANKPVFAMLWTNMTHYPYFTHGDDLEIGEKENHFNRYLNALHSGDEAFGALMSWLQQRKLVDQTLVVVVGDHGEAFGRHGQLSHPNKIYEENCHVPLLLINPRLFSGQRLATVGGMVDIAPTVAEILGQQPPGIWQGRSLFSQSRPNRTYFFAPWSDYLFGYREANMKFVYNATKGSYELYDLSIDPTERRNIVAGHRKDIPIHMQRLAAWVQHQNRYFQ